VLPPAGLCTQNVPPSACLVAFGWPADQLLHDRQALSLVRQTWVQLIPLCDWLCEHVGPPQ
jgi:hypothetical protein